MKNFKVSVIMSVYNVEEWIREAVDSVINQTLDFQENIQIVFVDDGSTDDSGKICGDYQKRFPENIEVIHKENEGLAEARLSGMPLARGKYISFFDPDDILSDDVMEKVLNFYEKYGDTVDVVSIPMFLFGMQSGPHTLNYKFRNGSRVIDLLEEWNSIQLSLATSFIRRDAMSEFSADPELRTVEDAKEILKILIQKKKLGVVSDCKYHYRKRSNANLDNVQNNPSWYLPSLKKFSKWALDYSKEKLGYIPEFVQYMVLYELQWKYRQQGIVPGVLSDEEETEYQQLLFSFANCFEDQVIWAQQNIYAEHKIHLLMKKYSSLPKTWWDAGHNNIFLYYPNSCFFYNLKSLRLTISIVELSEEQLIIRGYIPSFHKELMVNKLFAYLDDSKIAEADWYEPNISFSVNEPILYKQFFSINIPLSQSSKNYNISFQLEYSFGTLRVANIAYGGLSTVQIGKCGFYLKDNWRIEGFQDRISVEALSKIGKMKTEAARILRLWRIGKPMTRKAAVLRPIVSFCKLVKRSQFWLISDRPDRASDNGEALFRYLCEKKPRGITPIYALQKNSVDFDRMKKVGKVVEYDSWLYKFIFLLSDKIISSDADYYVTNPFEGDNRCYHDLIKEKPFIFLQHGVTKDDISGWLNLFNKNIKGFITAAYPEYDSILHGTYFYTEKEVWLTGFARFDRLYQNSKKKITFMPTWRKYLFGNQLDENHYFDLKSGFEKSAYYQFYNSLFNNKKLLNAARKNGYELQLFIHPNMMKSLDYFRFSPEISILKKDTQYRDVYAESDLILTDYSSVVFDFAYLRKPIIYMHFDADEFFKGEHVYKRGYFDYERDGFGEVEYNVESTVDRIIEYMENACQLKAIYKERIDRFFAFNDQENCERIVNKILEMDR